MTEHYTAWLTTDPSALDQDNADLTVLKDRWTGDEWVSEGNPVFYEVTTHRADEDDNGDLLQDAEALLILGGWYKAPGANWENVTTGATLSVTRME